MFNFKVLQLQTHVLKSTFLVAALVAALMVICLSDICIINIWKLRGKSISRVFLQNSKILWYVETHVTQYIYKFLKFEEMEYPIHHVKVEMWPALCKFPI